MPAEGAVAPDFQLGSFHLAEELRQGPVLLVFFKISCPTCQFTMPFLKRLADAAVPGAPKLVAISQDNLKNTEMFRQRFGPTDAALIEDSPYPVSTLYQLRNVPSLFLIEPGGAISMSVTGFSKSQLEILGERFGAAPFAEGEAIPLMRPG